MHMKYIANETYDLYHPIYFTYTALYIFQNIMRGMAINITQLFTNVIQKFLDIIMSNDA